MAENPGPFIPTVAVFDEHGLRIVHVTLRPELAKYATDLDKVGFASAYMREGEASPTFLTIHLPLPPVSALEPKPAPKESAPPAELVEAVAEALALARNPHKGWTFEDLARAALSVISRRAVTDARLAEAERLLQQAEAFVNWGGNERLQNEIAAYFAARAKENPR